MITSKHLNDSKRVKDLLAKQKSDFSNQFPHPVDEIWGPNSMPGDQFYRVIGTLRNQRDYGEYCTDFIEENALELYLNGVDLGSLGHELKARNPKEFGKIKCDKINSQNTGKVSCSQKQSISEIVRYTAHKIGE